MKKGSPSASTVLGRCSPSCEKQWHFGGSCPYVKGSRDSLFQKWKFRSGWAVSAPWGCWAPRVLPCTCLFSLLMHVDLRAAMVTKHPAAFLTNKYVVLCMQCKIHIHRKRVCCLWSVSVIRFIASVPLFFFHMFILVLIFAFISIFASQNWLQ